MAIVRDFNPDSEEWRKIELIIYDVILKRKYKFNYDTILKSIKGELVNKKFDLNITDDSYFHLILRIALEKLSDEEGKLYRMDETEIYIPIDYIIYEDYNTKNANLFYFIKSGSNYNFIDVASGRTTRKIKKNDIILCGGLNKNNETIQSSVSFENIYYLFHDFINEGASKEEAINHILNFYKIGKMDKRYSYAIDYNVGNKVKNRRLIKEQS